MRFFVHGLRQRIHALPSLLAVLTAALLAQPASAAAPAIKLILAAPPPATVATGIVADGAASLLVLVEAASPPASAAITVSNEATLVPYEANFATTPPAGGAADLTVSGSQIVQYAPGEYVLALLQAPDILHDGPGGGTPSYAAPVSVTVTIPNLPEATLSAKLYPPPILFLHGLWGDATSLEAMSTNLSKRAPWKNLPSVFLTRFAYTNDAAFDSSGIEDTVESEINAIGATLAADDIAVGRVDVVAHSMGGLVARHFSALSSYFSASSRTLGLFHEIVTLNTPETGSALATFLINNQGATFSPGTSLIAQIFLDLACPNATTAAGCLAAEGEDLAPPGMPLTAGAVFSLEPTSPNIAALPSANVPNAPWRASSSTVSQADSLLDGNTNALVFDLDELIFATCPGASYCPKASSPVPTVGSIMNTSENDGVVPLASQTAGCSATCVSQSFKKLAHTQAPLASLQGIALSTGNVLQSASVDGFVACKLANTLCAAAERVNVPAPSAAENPAGEQPGAGVLRMVKPLWITPESAVQGANFSVRLKLPFAQVKAVHVREMDGQGGFARLEAAIQAGPDGDTRVTITPLLMGRIEFIVNADLTETGFASRDFTLSVLPPAERPQTFYADQVWQNALPNAPMVLHVGNKRVLKPAVMFAAAPGRFVDIARHATFTAIQDAQAPVIDLQPDGHFTALRQGKATIEVGFAGFTSTIDVDVNQSAQVMMDR